MTIEFEFDNKLQHIPKEAEKSTHFRIAAGDLSYVIHPVSSQCVCVNKNIHTYIPVYANIHMCIHKHI